MLQSEIGNLRTRVKAMQETIEALTQKNTLLLAEKATGTWINSGSFKLIATDILVLRNSCAPN